MASSAGLVVDIVADAESTITPAKLAATAAVAGGVELQSMWRQAYSLHQASWVAMAIIAGEACARIGTREPGQEPITLDDVAALFEKHRTYISKMARVYEMILKPRIDVQGENATFPIEQSFYELACDAAKFTGRSALEFIDEAEDIKSGERLTVREFRQLLLDKGSLPKTEAPNGSNALAARLAASLQDIVGTPDDVQDAAIKILADDLPEVLTGVEAVVERMRKRRTAVLKKTRTRER